MHVFFMLLDIAYHHHVALQRGIPLPCRFPPASHDQRARRMAREGRGKASPYCRFVHTRPLFFLPILTNFTETEKYAHVTFFFNGGVEKQFDNEERHMISSPKVATYDKMPKMSVHGVADKVAAVLKEGEHEFVMCNFAPPDMVRHETHGRKPFLTSFCSPGRTYRRLRSRGGSDH